MTTDDTAETTAETLVSEILTNDSLTNINKADEVEIRLRNHLMDLLIGSNTSSSNDNVSALTSFIDSAMKLCLDENHYTILSKIPFLLIEDSLDCLDASRAKDLWRHMDRHYKSKLCDAKYFAKGKLTLLRFCNKFLQKLGNRSNAENTEFCGTILSFLTHAFPLSERSALNITGKYNIDNLATFESEEEFQELQQMDAENDDGQTNNNAESSSSGDADMELYADLPSDLSHLSKRHPDRLPIDYNFYKTLWGLQSYLRRPNLVLVEDSGGAADEFVQSLNVVLDAFEGHPLNKSNETTKQQQQHDASNHLYLTSSRLLSLQMSDPEIRMHLLTQMIMILSYLIAKTSIVKLKTAFTIVKKKAEDMLGAIPSDGKEMVNLLTYILDTREALWTKWKSDGCPPLTTVAITPLKVVNGDDDSVIKSKLLGAAPSNEMNDAVVGVKQIETDEIILFDKKLATGVPKMVDYLDDFVEAMDPESGIEEEYHPKNDKKFCWRALRIFRCNGQIYRFNKVTGDGNIEGIVRAIWGDQNIELPAPPAPEVGENDEIIPSSEVRMEEELMGELTRVAAIEDVAMKDEENDVDDDKSSRDGDSNNGERAGYEEALIEKEEVEAKLSNGQSSSNQGKSEIKEEEEEKQPQAKMARNDNLAADVVSAASDKEEKHNGKKRSKEDEDEDEVHLKEKENSEELSNKREEDQKIDTSLDSDDLPAVYVTNIAWELSTKDLLEKLESIGCKGILSIDMPAAQGRRGNDGKAWAMFEHKADVNAALKRINNAREVGGRRLKAQDSRRRRLPVSPKDAHKTKIQVRKLPHDLMARAFEWEMRALCGRVMNVQLPKSKNGHPNNNQGYGFLEFKHPLEAQFALQKLNRMKLFGGVIYAEFAMNQGPPPSNLSVSSKHASDNKAENGNARGENRSKRTSESSGDKGKAEVTRNNKTSTRPLNEERSLSEEGEALDEKVDSSTDKKGRSGEKSGDKSGKGDSDVSSSRGKGSHGRKNGGGKSSHGSKREESSRKRQRSPDEESRDNRRSRRSGSPDRGRDRGRDRDRDRDRDSQASKRNSGGSERRRGGDRPSRKRRGGR